LNPVNSLIFHSIKIATQSHLQINSLNWLDSACDNLVHPCNTLTLVATVESETAGEAEAEIKGTLDVLAVHTPIPEPTSASVA
jgi:hypothetical protein